MLGRHAKWLLMIAFLLCSVATATWWMSSSPTNASNRARPQLPALTEFELTAASGETFQSSQLEGKVWVASYFFTQCGGNCRTLNMELARMQREFGPRGLHFVSFTCDPQNDSPEELTKYADLLNADRQSWTFLTGDMGYLTRVGNDLVQLPVSHRAHHTQITIIDRDGEPRGTFDVVAPSDLKRAKKLIDELLADESADQPKAVAQSSESARPF